MASRYYIRFRGRKLGPLTVERLHSLARRGRFARHYEVSTDGKRWAPAADFPELFPDSAPQEDDGFGDEFDMDEMPEDPWVDPYDDPKKKKKKRRSRPKQSFTPPPPPPVVDPYDEPISEESRPSARRKRIRRSSSSGSDDDLDSGGGAPPPIIEEIIEDSAPVVRRVRRGSAPAVESADAEDAPLSDAPPARSGGPAQAGGVDAAPVAGGGNLGSVNVNVSIQHSERRPASHNPTPRKAAPSLFDVASAKSAKLGEGGEEAAAPEPAKKKKFFGIFGGKTDSNAGLEPFLKKLYDLTEALPAMKFAMEKLILIGSGGEEIHVADHMKSGDGVDIIGLLTMLAFQSKSTDIHFEPSQDGANVRMRIDGSLVQLVNLPRKATNRSYGVVKVLCEVDLGSRRDVQEGNYSVLAPGKRSDYRVSFTPSVHGQKLAIRVLDLDNSPQSLKQLGAPPRMVRTLRDVMAQNAGMILMCGPTGSGKTTTLYSLIRSIDAKTRNVMTLEDPVEYQIDDVTQIPIDSEHGKGFAEMLPALLRQDPDVLLVGEIRDAVSAKIAMQATMTGHLVLSTVHSPDTLSTLYRLLDLNADANMVGSALDIVLSQRLVKVLCRDCKHRRKISKPEAQRLGRYARDSVYEPRGCRRCLGTGFSGRRAIFEMLDVKHQLGDAIYQAQSLGDLKKSVDRKTFQTLRQSGHQLVAKGVTSFSEVDRVIGLG